MRKLMGILTILLCGGLVWYITEQLFGEWYVAQEREEKIQASIELPEIHNAIPVTLFDENNNPFYETYAEWRVPLQLEETPLIAQQLVLLSEDVGFYDHIGFDVSAIARAFVANSGSGAKGQGGSTITQQLVRMRYLNEEKTYERKVLELFYAYELEKVLTKEQILTAYLNEMYYSNQVYGIGGAATYYFQRPIQQLTTAEVAFLAAIPNNPSHYNPLIHFDNTKARQEMLIDVLAKHNVLSLEQAEAEKAQVITLNVKPKLEKAPAYASYALHEFTQLVGAKENYTERIRKAKTEDSKLAIEKQLDERVHYLLQSGVNIQTNLRPDKQARDEAAINRVLGGDLQSGVTTIDNTTRGIVSIYGGNQYAPTQFNRAYQAVRQPGSTLKPLMVYAPLFETTSYTPQSYVNAGRYCIGNYCPRNYGNAVYGEVPIMTAFRYSYNTPAVRLLNTIGLSTGYQYLQQFNFKHLVPQDENFATALGGLTVGISTDELADAYTSFIDGSYMPARAIRQVTDTAGNVLYKWDDKLDYVWSGRTTRYMRQMLADVVNNGTAKKVYTNTSYVGAKTGTTNDYKDFWIAGLSDRYTSAVWLGYDTPRNMEWLEKKYLHHHILSITIE
ncbi:penicillin-binding protein 4 [Lysinibacillus alkalisoli]|uniref:Penicillin-binding protein 4 n=1 Tax=Lysinibacillus alkalisoli TaxID=1911548 RepID=A0A917G694_9BACI|nr:transglycosylase domain-containing protein [Lysinibacillus alkalisoli]GGG24689.1 penicillin-binding protein 4 [Lysinibacillus alkalisoli]